MDVVAGFQQIDIDTAWHEGAVRIASVPIDGLSGLEDLIRDLSPVEVGDHEAGFRMIVRQGEGSGAVRGTARSEWVWKGPRLPPRWGACWIVMGCHFNVLSVLI